MNDPVIPLGTEEARAQLDVSLQRCWRQTHEIHSLNETIAVYRRGASSLASQNAGLRREVACLRARHLSRGDQAARTPTTPASWVQVGTNACGLVLADRLVAFVCWRRSDAADLAQVSGHTHGFWWFSTARPSQILLLFEAEVPTARDWVRARALGARAHFEDAGPQTTREPLRQLLLGRRWLPEGTHRTPGP